MAYTLEAKITFLFEKWSESYQEYDEVVYAVAQIQKTKEFCFLIEQRGKRRSRYIAKEKVILAQEALWCFWQSQKAESAGV